MRGRKTFNIISYIVLPILIIVTMVGMCYASHKSFWKPTVNIAELGENYESGYFTCVAKAIENNDEKYVVYAIRDKDNNRQDYLVAFEYEEYSQIECINSDAYSSGNFHYWDGKYDIVDFAEFEDFDKSDIAVKDSELIKNIRVYDISAYRGYEIHYNNGVSIAESFMHIVLLGYGVIFLVVELIIATIVKLIIFRNKEKKNAKVKK